MFVLTWLLFFLGLPRACVSGDPVDEPPVTGIFSSKETETDARFPQKTILFLSCYQKSPIIALNGLAEEMHARGHRVLFATTRDDQHLVSSTSVGVEWIDGGDPPPGVAPAHTLGDLWTGEAAYATSMFAALLPLLQQPANKPDLIAFDCLSLAGEGLAAALGVPSVQLVPHLLGLGLLGSEAGAHHPTVISGVASSQMRSLDVLRNHMLRLASRYVLPVVRGVLQNSARQEMGLPAVWFEAQNPYGHSRLLLAAAPIGFEPPRALPPLVQATGPFLPRAQRALKPELAAWLDEAPTGPGLVFVSIGTNSVWGEAVGTAVLTAMVEGVERGQFRCLLLIKAEHRASFTPALMERAALLPGLRIAPFVEQLAILAHPQTWAFLTHGGLSSLAEAMYYGVPIIAMPMMLESDQPTNAARVVELGLGCWIDRRAGEPTAGDVLAAVGGVVASRSQYRNQTQRWQQAMHALQGRAQAGRWLEAALSPAHIVDLLQPSSRVCWEIWVLNVGLVALAWALLEWGRRRISQGLGTSGSRGGRASAGDTGSTAATPGTASETHIKQQ